MTTNGEGMSVASEQNLKDPKQLEWAIGDLGDFASHPWSGGNMVITAPEVRVLRAACALVHAAFTNGHLLAGENLTTFRDMMGALQEDNEGLLNRIEQLRQNQETTSDARPAEHHKVLNNFLEVISERDTYKAIYELYREEVGGVIDVLDMLESYGYGTENPVVAITDQLKGVQRQAAEDASRHANSFRSD